MMKTSAFTTTTAKMGLTVAAGFRIGCGLTLFLLAMAAVIRPGEADVVTVRVPGETSIKAERYEARLPRSDITLYKFLGAKGQTLKITFDPNHPEIAYSLLDLITKKAILVERREGWQGQLPTEGSYSLNVYFMPRANVTEDFVGQYTLVIDVNW